MLFGAGSLIKYIFSHSWWTDLSGMAYMVRRDRIHVWLLNSLETRSHNSKTIARSDPELHSGLYALRIDFMINQYSH